MSDTRLQITGMSCGHCSAAVTKALKAVPGVTDAQVDLSAGTANVQGQADAQTLVHAVEEAGYTAQVAA